MHLIWLASHQIIPFLIKRMSCVTLWRFQRLQISAMVKWWVENVKLIDYAKCLLLICYSGLLWHSLNLFFTCDLKGFSDKTIYWFVLEQSPQQYHYKFIHETSIRNVFPSIILLDAHNVLQVCFGGRWIVPASILCMVINGAFSGTGTDIRESLPIPHSLWGQRFQQILATHSRL